LSTKESTHKTWQKIAAQGRYAGFNGHGRQIEEYIRQRCKDGSLSKFAFTPSIYINDSHSHATLSSLKGEQNMASDISELDQMQRNYKTAVDEWVAAIRHEEALASVNHTVAEVDQWEHADDREEEARAKAKAAKKAYEDALRQEFFHF
jgi:hypothetical protein